MSSVMTWVSRYTTPVTESATPRVVNKRPSEADCRPAVCTSTALAAKAGKVTVKDVNPSSSGISHGIAVEGNGVDKDGTGGTSGVSPGKTATLTVTLKPGTYTFYCPVDGHKAAGMKGTLKVK